MSSTKGDLLQKSIWMKKTWKYSFDLNSKVNYGGYGDDNMYKPPLATPEYLATKYYKNSMLGPNPFNPTGFMHALQQFMAAPMVWLVNWVLNGSTGNTWYNNAMAQGSQLYPNEVALFYDMYSWNGWNAWLWDMLAFNFWYNLFGLAYIMPLFDGSVKVTDADSWAIWQIWGNFLLPGLGWMIKFWCMFVPKDCPLEYGWLYGRM